MRRALLVPAITLFGCGDQQPSAAADASVAVDAAVVDASAPRDARAETSADVGMCEPPDVSMFVPPAYVPPTGAHQGLCTSAQIATFYSACLATSHTSATCAAVGGPTASAADRACAACIVSQSTDPAYGPLIRYVGVLRVNLAGCMALLDPNAAPCAHASQIETACEDFMCSHPCPIDPCIYGWCYAACTQQAQQSSCSTYARAASCTEADGGAAAFCFGATTFEEYYARIVPLFCGPPASDASTD